LSRVKILLHLNDAIYPAGVPAHQRAARALETISSWNGHWVGPMESALLQLAFSCFFLHSAHRFF
jgi:hypothetical protein